MHRSLKAAVAIAAMTVAAAALGQSSWSLQVQQFIGEHPDLKAGQNMALMQQAIDAESASHPTDWGLLNAAYARAKSSPGWTTGSPQPSHTGGLGVSAYSRGDIAGYRCTRPDGSVYYAKGACGNSVVGSSGPPTYTVTDANTGRVIARGVTGRHEVYDPVRGTYLQPWQMNWQASTSGGRVVTDQAQRIPVDQACEGAQRIANMHPSAQADKRVHDLCQQGRSLYDQRPSSGSLYSHP